MLRTRIFRESPFKALKILGIIFGGILLFFAFVFLSDEMPRWTADGLNKQAFALVLITSIFGGIMLITFLALSFEARKLIKCDFEGCEILEANFWQTVGFANEFKWSDVKDTQIVEKQIDIAEGGIVSIYTFVAQTPKGAINLMDFKTSSRKNIEGLINFVNQATPQTKYVWIKDAAAENPAAVESVYGFSKIARD